MKQSLTCPQCAGRRIWNLRDAKEHSSWGPAPLGAPQQLDPLEAFLCHGCGYTEWYSSHPQKLQPHTGIEDVELPCGRCDSHRHLLVARFAEADTMHVTGTTVDWSTPLAVLRAHGVVAGTFAVLICRGCGHLRWFACDLPPLQHEVARNCARCGETPLGRINKVEEADGWNLPVHLTLCSDIGRFYLDVCNACGFTDWFGERYDKLYANGYNVLLLEGNP